MRYWRQCVFLVLVLGLASTALAGSGARRVAPVAMIRVAGAIDVPSQAYLQRALAQAQRQGAQAFLVLLDTPGGLVEPMTEMTKALLNAPLPTIVYVSPAGAYAMSAGTFITMSANIAAMQPATSIGAAHPVDIFGSSPGGNAPEEEGKKPATPSSDVMSQKIENAFSQQAKTIAERRGRNAAWAEKAVRNSIAATATEAVRLHVVDLMAEDVDDLLAEIDGRQVTLAGGRTVTLHTATARVEEIPANANESFLHVLASPNLLLVLLALAGLGLMFELQNPGAILPGVVGGIALLLALYSMAALPVNYAGVGLIVFGMLLLLAEVKVASHGILSVGGVISFVMGALMLTDVALAPAMRVSWQVLMVVTVLVAGFFLIVVGAAIRAHLRKVQTGVEAMRQAHGRALESLRPAGEVLVEGERWRARALEGESIAAGDEIEVVGEEGLTLFVRARRAATPGPQGRGTGAG